MMKPPECEIRSVDPARVESTRAALPAPDDVGRVAETFKLLGDPNRARILFALREAGELCVCDLAATVDMSETSVSQALRLLRAAGIVRNRRDGRMSWYRLDDAHVGTLLDASFDHLGRVGV